MSELEPILKGGVQYEGQRPDCGFIDVTDGHSLAYEVWGWGPRKVIHQHGGPGQGYDLTHTTIYDPNEHTVAFYDQRASGRSAHSDLLGLEGNTTPALVEDIMRVADHVGFAAYNLAGGSWGSGLSLMHAVRYPERVQDLLLWGMFTGLPEDYELAINLRARTHAPNEFTRLIEQIPGSTEARYQDIARILLSKVAAEEFGSEGKAAAAAFGIYQFKLAEPVDPIDEATKGIYDVINSDMVRELASADLYDLYCMAMGVDLRKQAAVPLHYFANGGFITDEIHPFKNTHKITGKTVHIINGALDYNTPPETAEKVHRILTEAGVDSRLQVVEGAGHLRNDRQLNIALRTAALRLK